eukprot:TRINITY_DN6244_c0_g1_i3.p1 TRINITY_DN6244_c0_g1~~TRINITY_DN6244_c0_g1_i3.p1  ORF type:complete len:130 (+),score=4.34 TRINITY_DN6244_c0_g1_i3:24-413(+)
MSLVLKSHASSLFLSLGKCILDYSRFGNSLAVPIHFDLFGRPDWFVPGVGMFIYPMIQASLFASAYFSPEQDSQIISLISCAFLLPIQYFASQIGQQKRGTLPLAIVPAMLISLFGYTIYSKYIRHNDK